MHSVLEGEVFKRVLRPQAYLSESLVAEEVVIRADTLCLDFERLVQSVVLLHMLGLRRPLGSVLDLLKQGVGHPCLQEDVLIKEGKLVPEVPPNEFLDDSHVWQSLASFLEHHFQFLRTEAAVV